MTEELQKELAQIFEAMGNAKGNFVIGQVVGSQTNYFGGRQNEPAQTEQEEEIGQTEQNPKEKEKEPPNYFAPQKNLSVFLCQDWFDECSSNKKKYSCEWREGLMEALLASDYKDGIAAEWLQKKKHAQMKCAIVGVLIDAKVLKGSYRSVAASLRLADLQSASLARYMSKAKNKPYYEWLLAMAKN